MHVESAAASERERQFVGAEAIESDAGCGSGAVVTVVIAEGRAAGYRRWTGEVGAIGQQWWAGFAIARRPAVAVLVAHHPHFDDRGPTALTDSWASSCEQRDLNGTKQ